MVNAIFAYLFTPRVLCLPKLFAIDLFFSFAFLRHRVNLCKSIFSSNGTV